MAPSAPSAPAGDDYEILARLLTPTEATLMQACLSAAGVDAVVGDAHLVQTDMLLFNAVGGANVRVLRSQIDGARAVLAAWKAGDFALGDDFDPGPGPGA
jgi:hypothetical protein